MKTASAHNKEVKQAHKIHSKAVQPFLQKIINLVQKRPKMSKIELKNEIELINGFWKRYCSKYQATHKDRHPNRAAFIDSLKMYFKSNKTLSDNDFNFIFNEN